MKKVGVSHALDSRLWTLEARSESESEKRRSCWLKTVTSHERLRRRNVVGTRGSRMEASPSSHFSPPHSHLPLLSARFGFLAVAVAAHQTPII